MDAQKLEEDIKNLNNIINQASNKNLDRDDYSQTREYIKQQIQTIINAGGSGSMIEAIGERLQASLSNSASFIMDLTDSDYLDLSVFLNFALVQKELERRLLINN